MVSKILMNGYNYASNKASIVCRHIIEGGPILGFFHDSDGDIHFTCGIETHNTSDWMVLSLDQLVILRPEVLGIPVVHPNEVAERNARDGVWVVGNVGSR